MDQGHTEEEIDEVQKYESSESEDIHDFTVNEVGKATTFLVGRTSRFGRAVSIT